MKKNIITSFFILSSISVIAQDQVINGTLSTKGTIYIGSDVENKWGLGEKLVLRGTDLSSDLAWLAKYTDKNEYTDLRINVGDGLDPQDRFTVGTTTWNTGKWYNLFVVRMDGNVGVGVDQPTSKLDVNGTIRATEIKIEALPWSDFVFNKDYKLPTLQEVENHINEYKHLPDIPSESEVKENGVSLGEMQAKLLQKIEELTLYTIELNKTVKEQGEKIQKLEAERDNK